MTMLIEAGRYDVKQYIGTHLVEVGKLVVVATPQVKQHWYLYTEVPAPADPKNPSYGLYTVPSNQKSHHAWHEPHRDARHDLF